VQGGGLGNSPLVAAARSTRGLSTPLTPCAGANYFAGGGAEWRWGCTHINWCFDCKVAACVCV
jgi:hypothetical protein